MNAPNPILSVGGAQLCSQEHMEVAASLLQSKTSVGKRLLHLFGCMAEFGGAPQGTCDLHALLSSNGECLKCTALI